MPTPIDAVSRSEPPACIEANSWCFRNWIGAWLFYVAFFGASAWEISWTDGKAWFDRTFGQRTELEHVGFGVVTGVIIAIATLGSGRLLARQGEKP